MDRKYLFDVTIVFENGTEKTGSAWIEVTEEEHQEMLRCAKNRHEDWTGDIMYGIETKIEDNIFEMIDMNDLDEGQDLGDAQILCFLPDEIYAEAR